MPRRPCILHSRVMFTGRVFGVRRDRVTEPGGMTSTRDVVTHNGSVVVLPVLADGRILLIRQYRHAIGGYLWELVAGRVEPGERPRAAARRELVEETGYTARRFRPLLDLFPTPGFVAENMVIFLATGLRPGLPQPDGDERIIARAFSLAQLQRSMRAGRLRDAKSVAAILFYARFVRRRRR